MSKCLLKEFKNDEFINKVYDNYFYKRCEHNLCEAYSIILYNIITIKEKFDSDTNRALKEAILIESEKDYKLCKNYRSFKCILKSLNIYDGYFLYFVSNTNIIYLILNNSKIIRKINKLNDIDDFITYFVKFFRNSFIYDYNFNKRIYPEDKAYNSTIKTFHIKFLNSFCNSDCDYNISNYNDIYHKENILLNIFKYYYLNNIPIYCNRIVKTYGKFYNYNDDKNYYFYLYFNKNGVLQLSYTNNSSIINIFRIKELNPKLFLLKEGKSFKEINDYVLSNEERNNINNYNCNNVDSYSKDSFDPYKYFNMKNINKYLYFKNKYLNIYKSNDDITETKKVFDFINLQIGFLSFSKENVKFLKENKKHVLKRAYEFINKSKKFQYYNIPINFIKCTKFVYKRDGIIDLIFELKTIQ